jgi:Undecaprenyl-phosphate glucose phosphotransferase
VERGEGAFHERHSGTPNAAAAAIAPDLASGDEPRRANSPPTSDPAREAGMQGASTIARPVPTSLIAEFVRGTDLVICLVAGTLSHQLFVVSSDAVSAEFRGLAILLGALLQVNIFHFVGLYRCEAAVRRLWDLGRLSIAWMAVFSVLAASVLVLGMIESAREWLLLWFASGLVLFAPSRMAVRSFTRYWQRQGRFDRNVIVVGRGEYLERTIAALKEATNSNVRLLGVFDDGHAPLPPFVGGSPHLGTIDGITEFARLTRVDQVLVALPWSDKENIEAIFDDLRLLPVDVRLCPELLSYRLAHAGSSQIGSLPLINVFNRPLSPGQRILKGVEDRVLAAFFLTVGFPLMGLLALIIKIDSAGPVLFRQNRYGFRNELICVYKFRTIHQHESDQNAERLVTQDDDRVTRVGRILRRFSLDELPQLVNVLKGEMSIVGPRPHAVFAKAEGRLYPDVVEDYAARHRVKPGMTGWAQVNGWRGETDRIFKLTRRVEHDFFYIDNWSLWFDIKIIFMTFVTIFKSKSAAY